MIVPMKKVSLIIRESEKDKTLKKLRSLGILHIEITEGTGGRLANLKEQVALLESAIFTIGKIKNTEQKNVNAADALTIATEVNSLDEEKKRCQAEKVALDAELDRLKSWGDIVPSVLSDLESKGIEILFYEMPKAEYENLSDNVKTVRIDTTKSTVKFMLFKSNDEENEKFVSSLNVYRLALPQMSTDEMKQRISDLYNRIAEIDEIIVSHACYIKSIKQAIKNVEKEIEFETYTTGMSDENLSPDNKKPVTVAYFKGYIEAENLDKLKQTAEKNAWGILVEEPSTEDNVPTKLKNNKFVSLIYPLTDFLGTVPGYFEYDISGWFLAFILIFFGIIFGDGGYGLLIFAVAAIPIIKSLISKKQISPMFLLVGLFGLSTVLWGTLTCTWFGLSPEQLPEWLKSLSVPVISNVYADKIWHPFWTNGTVGLTTAQNLQIFCFSLALIQLTVAHIKVQ